MTLSQAKPCQVTRHMSKEEAEKYIYNYRLSSAVGRESAQGRVAQLSLHIEQQVQQLKATYTLILQYLNTSYTSS